MMGTTRRWFALGITAALVVVPALVTSCKATMGRPKAVFVKREGPNISYTVPNVSQLFPVAGSQLVPAVYSSTPQLASLQSSVAWFTGQSLQADGIQFSNLSVAPDGTISLTSSDPGIESAITMQQNFFGNSYGLQAYNGATRCFQQSGCWDPVPEASQPWAFWLPLGLPMVNQKAVLLLDYPPATSLKSANYLDNATMKRWARLLGVAGGVTNPLLYETIVDARPIAAPGGKAPNKVPESQLLPPPKWFLDQSHQSYYTTMMLLLLTNVASNPNPDYTLPVAVLGGPAATAWQAITGGAAPSPLDFGNAMLPNSSKQTPWVASNHPIQTAYKCCFADSACLSDDQNIAFSESVDLQGVCILGALSSPGTNPRMCLQNWALNDNQCIPSNNCTMKNPQNQHAFCVQVKLDINYDSPAQCKCQATAEDWCSKHGDNPCQTLDCSSTVICPLGK
jgi:hypothetical protein